MKIFPNCWPFLLIIEFILLLSQIALPAQTGLLFDDKAYSEFTLLELSPTKNEILPGLVSLRKFCPFPQSQGPIASCVGWAVGYAALTIQEAARQGITDRAYITGKLAHSASYIYNQIKNAGDCSAGASLTDAMKLVYDQGVCLAGTFPNSRTSCEAIPSEEARREAARYRIPTAAFKVFDSKWEAKSKTEATRLQLALGNPVVIGFSITPDYGPLRGKSVWQPGQQGGGGHAMVVIGYNDRLQMFELMNSFGTGWGDQGFISLSYTDFGEFARQGFVFQRKDRAKGRDLNSVVFSDIPVSLQGSMHLQYATGLGVEPRFEPVQLTLQPENDVYLADRDNWKLDEDLFQLRVWAPKGRCVYLFSIDVEGRADSLWATEQLPEDTLITLPQKGYFQYSRPGEEFLCLMISYEVIDQFSARLRSIRTRSSSGLYEELQRAFGRLLVDRETITYQLEHPSFETVARYGQGVAAPLIIKLRIGQ